jgi:lysophospholipase L1-like esterase
VADSQEAELIDLHAAGVDAVEAGTFASLVSDDGFHPSTEGHARIADVFAAAL